MAYFTNIHYKLVNISRYVHWFNNLNYLHWLKTLVEEGLFSIVSKVIFTYLPLALAKIQFFFICKVRIME